MRWELYPDGAFAVVSHHNKPWKSVSKVWMGAHPKVLTPLNVIKQL